MPQEKIDDISRLSRLVVRVLGLNPGPFTLQGTNTYLVGAGRSRLLIDVGEDMPGYVELLHKVMEQNGVERISDVLITHYHRDHSEGLKSLRRAFGEDLRAWKFQAAYKGEHGPSFDLVKAGVRELTDGQELSTEEGDATVRVLATPGHTPDHVCFVLREEGAVFSGDCVLGDTSAVFEDLSQYMRSLQILLETFPPTNGSASTTCPEARRIYPAHGPLIVDGYNKVREYIDHRSAREQQVLAALREIRKSPLLRYTGLSPFGIVRAIYPSLSWKLRIAAAWNVEKHLDKLEAEGVARRRDWLGLPLPPIMGIRIDRIFLRRWFPH